MKRLVLLGVFTVFLMFASTAGASEIKVLTQPAVKGDSVSSLGTVLIKITGGALKKGDLGLFSLPKNFRFCNEDESTMTQGDWVEQLSNEAIMVGNAKNYVKIPRKYGGKENALYGQGNLSVTQLDENEIMLKVNTTPDISHDSYILLYLGAIYINEDAGEIIMSMRAPSGSGFPFPSIDKLGKTGGAKVKLNADIEQDDAQKDQVDGDKTDPAEKTVAEEVETTGIDNKIIKFAIGSMQATLNGSTVSLDAAPYINSSGFTMVPLRFIAEALDVRVEWLPNLSQVNVYGDSDILMNIETGAVYIDNSIYQLPSPPEVIVPGRVFVPLRFVSEIQDTEIDYEKNHKVITIKR